MTEFAPSSPGQDLEEDALPYIDEAVRALRALVLAAHTFRQEFANALDLTISDTLAMSHLVAAGSLSAGELALCSGFAPSSVTAMVDRLERAGLARRTTRAGNRRTFDIALTDRGIRALQLSSRWTRSAVADVGGDQLPELSRTLNALATSLRSEAIAFSAAMTNNELSELLETDLPDK